MRDTSWWGLGLFVVVLVVLHFVLRVGLGYATLAPDLLVVALLVAARQMRAGWAAGLGLVLGLLEGAVLPLGFGSEAVVLTILGFLGARSRDLFSGDSLIALVVYLFVGKWLYEVLLALVSGVIFDLDAVSLVVFSPLAALYAAVAGLIAVALYRVLD